MFSHKNLDLSCKDSPACDLCVWVWERGRKEAELERSHAAATVWLMFFTSSNLPSCHLCYICSFFHSFSHSVSSKQVPICCNLLRLEEGLGRYKLKKSLFWSVCYTVYCTFTDNEIHQSVQETRILWSQEWMQILDTRFTMWFNPDSIKRSVTTMFDSEYLCFIPLFFVFWHWFEFICKKNNHILNTAKWK